MSSTFGFLPRRVRSATGPFDAVDLALERALADPAIDLVLAMGVIASDRAVRLHDIPKPVIAPFIIDAEIQGTPRDDRSSGVTNLNYLSSSITLRRDLEVFQRLRPFEKLVMLHGPALNDIPGVRERLREVVSDFDVELTLVEIRKRADEALPRIPPDAEAVYVNALVQLVEGELEKLATGLIERRLPSFSRLGRAEVERGLLMSLTEDVFDRRARRVALNVQRALLGEDPATFPVDFVMREELVINMSTARAINVFPSFALETVAQLIQDERPEEGRRLNLVLVADEALAANRDLVAFNAEVLAGAENIPIAKSRLLPQLDLVATGAVIDGDRAEATGQPEYLFGPGLTLTQLIYSDPAWANKAIQEDLQRALELDRDSFRLDIIQQSTTTYLDVMRALTSERIQKDNLSLTRSNLELARVRESIGASGRAEVYRWEAQLPADQGAVIRAAANRNLAEIELNRLLHRPLEEPFTTQEIGVEDRTFMYMRAQFYPYISSREYFGKTRDALVLIALEQSPEAGRSTRPSRRSEEASNRRAEHSICRTSSFKQVSSISTKVAPAGWARFKASVPFFRSSISPRPTTRTGRSAWICLSRSSRAVTVPPFAGRTPKGSRSFGFKGSRLPSASSRRFARRSRPPARPTPESSSRGMPPRPRDVIWIS